MIKKDIFGGDVKAQLRAAAKDRIHRFMMAGGTFKGAVIHATRMVNEMRANHELGIIETLILGQAYIASGLLTSTMKGRDRIGIRVECSGQVQGLDVESNVFGEVRGYIKNTRISETSRGNETELSSFFGAGFLTVTKYLTEARQPYSGKVMLEYGNLALDLANYFVQSEQTPTAFHLSIHFDDEGQVAGAGGLMVQAMPGAEDSVIKRIEEQISGLDSLGRLFAGESDPESIVRETFEAFDPVISENHRVEFFCRCTHDSILGYLAALPMKDRKDIMKNGPFPLEIRCHNCNTVYGFSKEDIIAIN